MNEMILSAQAAQQGSGMSVIVMIGLMVVIFWFFILRPNQKTQKKIRNFQNSLKEGTKVVIGNGIYGSVKRVDLAKNLVDVEIAHGVVVTVDKNAVFEDLASAAVK